MTWITDEECHAHSSLLHHVMHEQAEHSLLPELAEVHHHREGAHLPDLDQRGIGMHVAELPDSPWDELGPFPALLHPGGSYPVQPPPCRPNQPAATGKP